MYRGNYIFRGPRAALKSMLNSLSDTGCLLITVPDGRLDRSYQHINFWSPESFGGVFLKIILIMTNTHTV